MNLKLPTPVLTIIYIIEHSIPYKNKVLYARSISQYIFNSCDSSILNIFKWFDIGHVFAPQQKKHLSQTLACCLFSAVKSPKFYVFINDFSVIARFCWQFCSCNTISKERCNKGRKGQSSVAAEYVVFQPPNHWQTCLLWT